MITDHLLRIDQPHLVVRCWGNGVSVRSAGPCRPDLMSELRRPGSQRRPQWPVVLNQLSRLRVSHASPAGLGGISCRGAGLGISPWGARCGICWHDTRAPAGQTCLEMPDTPTSLGNPSRLRLRLARPNRMGPMNDQQAKPTNGVERHLAAESDGNSLARSRIPPRGETSLATSALLAAQPSDSAGDWAERPRRGE